jgi:hypothetical protein
MPAINSQAKAFSLLVYTGQPLPARLFPRKAALRYTRQCSVEVEMH